MADLNHGNFSEQSSLGSRKKAKKWQKKIENKQKISKAKGTRKKASVVECPGSFIGFRRAAGAFRVSQV
jgi:hypothetical protein